jgi:hypothetical protein
MMCDNRIEERRGNEMIYVKKTATIAKGLKRKTIFALGRDDTLEGKDPRMGGYQVWKMSENYDGQVHGGIRKSWGYVAKDLSFNEAVRLMNKRCHDKVFVEVPEYDEAMK